MIENQYPPVDINPANDGAIISSPCLHYKMESTGKVLKVQSPWLSEMLSVVMPFCRNQAEHSVRCWCNVTCLECKTHLHGQ